MTVKLHLKLCHQKMGKLHAQREHPRPIVEKNRRRACPNRRLPVFLRQFGQGEAVYPIMSLWAAHHEPIKPKLYM